MTPTINDIISPMELDDLRHKYRNNDEVGRIIAYATYLRDAPDESEQELDNLMMRVVTAEVEQAEAEGLVERLANMLRAWLTHHDDPKEVKRIDEQTRELLREDGGL